VREAGDAAVGASFLDLHTEADSLYQAYDPRRFAALILVGAISLAVWFAVVVSLAPARLLTYIAFFAPLAVAITCLCAAGIYRLVGGDGRPRLRLLGSSMRRGFLLSCAVVANMGFVAGRRWSPLLFLLILGICLAVELVTWSRHHLWQVS
jgi:hypothetical protein